MSNSDFTIALVGAGTMGSGIAQVAAGAGFRVIVTDVNEMALRKAMERIGSGFDRLVAKGQMTRQAKAAAIPLIATTTDLATIAPAEDRRLILDSLHRVQGLRQAELTDEQKCRLMRVEHLL